MTFVDAAQFLLKQRDGDGNIIPEFWAPLLATIRNRSFFGLLGIASPFPNTEYYSLSVTIEQDALQLQPAGRPPRDAHQLIIRLTDQPLTALKTYILQEFAAYEAVTDQANELLYPIGFAPLSTGTLTIFLCNRLVTLESRLARDRDCPFAVKVRVAGAVIALLTEVHDAKISGFDLRPSTVLIQEESDDGVALIGFVGDRDALQTHPQAKQLQWDMKFAAPELKPAVKPTINSPTTSSDVYAVTCLVEWLLQSSDADSDGQQWNDTVRSMLSGGKQRQAKGRISAAELNCRFMATQSQLLKVLEAAESCEPSASLVPIADVHPHALKSAPVAPGTEATAQTPVPVSAGIPAPSRGRGRGASVEPLGPQSLRERIRDMSTPAATNPGCPPVFKVAQTIVAEKKSTGISAGLAEQPTMIRVVSVGPRPQKPRTQMRVLALGPTGSGKTTFVNGFPNYLYGVQWDDPFRFKIGTDDNEGSAAGVKRAAADSQTDRLTCYQLGWQSEFPIQHSVTIIDTPGFGDTRGIQRDRDTIDMLTQLFQGGGACGINSLDAVAIVVQSGCSRLDYHLKHIFDSVLKIFGKNFVDNIIIVATFADAETPKVLQSIAQYGIPHKYLCKFNNSALFASVAGDGGQVNQPFWNMGIDSYRQFFEIVQRLPPQGLELTRQVLGERKKLEATLENLSKTARDAVAKANEIAEEMRIIEQHSREIEANRNFVEQVRVQKSRRVDLKPGQYVTNCPLCNMTCHFPCSIADDGRKSKCTVMHEGHCTVCPRHCSCEVHHNMTWRWETYEEIEPRTLDELKQKYGDASAKKQAREKMLQNAEQQYDDISHQAMEHQRTLLECLNRLGEIAIRATPLSEIDYLNVLIKGEEAMAEPGWEARIAWYNHRLDQLKLLKRIVRDGESAAVLPARVISGAPPPASKPSSQLPRAKVHKH